MAPAELTWAGQGRLGEAVRQPPDAGLPRAPQEMLRAPWGGAGRGEGIPEHPWASPRVLCAGRGARHTLQRTLGTHSIPGRAQPCLQSSPWTFANPLVSPAALRSSLASEQLM